VDRRYVYRLVNRGYTHRVGLGRHRIEGRSVAEAMGAEAFRNLIKPKLDRALAGEAVQYEVTDATGKRAFANQRYLEFFGLAQNAIEGSAWSTLVHPDDFALLTDKFGDGLPSHRSFSSQCRLRRADGEWY
jgi:PAS domain-containing protein